MGTALLAPGAAPPLPGLSFLNCKICTPVSALFSREVGQSFNQQTVPEPHLAGTEQGGVQGGADCPIKRASPQPQVGSGGRYTACGPPFTCRQQQIGLSSSRAPPTADPDPSWDSEKRGHCSLAVGEAGVGAGTLDRSWGQEQLYTLLAR